MRSSAITFAAFVLATTACAGGNDTAARARSGATDPAAYTATATILESADHGPQLCLGAIAQSFPPQCGGPDIIGWDWDDVDGEESASGTTWGRFTVVGSWDGKAFTVAEVTLPAAPEDAVDEGDDDFATPCREPEGGWQIVDPTTATDEAMQAAMAYARSQATVGGTWVDQSINRALNRNPGDESAGNDPTRLILNLSFTDDLERHERVIRDVWGGALCVSEATMSARELTEIRGEVEREIGDFLFSAIDEVNGQVEIGVVVDDGLQARFDERYGPGVVDVQPALVPVET